MVWNDKDTFKPGSTETQFFTTQAKEKGVFFFTEPEWYLVNLTNCSIVLFVLDISLDEENISVYNIYL